MQVVFINYETFIVFAMLSANLQKYFQYNLELHNQLKWFYSTVYASMSSINLSVWSPDYMPY